MSDTDPAHDEPLHPDCTTTGSFSDHGIEDGSRLITETYYRIREAGYDEFEPTQSFFDALESAFMWAYLGSVDEPGIAPPVEAAIDDARAHTWERFADEPDADLRTQVVPEFYSSIAGFHCRYRS
jgi:hypothetical protein